MDASAAFHGNPNSAHQMWSRWTFGVRAAPAKQPTTAVVIDNARVFFAKGFKTHAGRVRCNRRGREYILIIEVEGPPAHDSGYVAAVKQTFIQKFLHPGFGYSAQLVTFEVGVLAGDQQDGRPPDQLLVLPQLDIPPDLMGDAGHGERAL